MNKKILAVVLALTALIAAYYVFQGYSKTSQVSAPAAGNNAPAVQGQAAAVAISGFSFEPASLTIKTGTTVVWTNNDAAPHRINSNTFNSPDLAKGQTFSFTFSAAGTYDYFCSIHPSMKGRIIVQ